MIVDIEDSYPIADDSKTPQELACITPGASHLPVIHAPLKPLKERIYTGLVICAEERPDIIALAFEITSPGNIGDIVTADIVKNHANYVAQCKGRDKLKELYLACGVDPGDDPIVLEGRPLGFKLKFAQKYFHPVEYFKYQTKYAPPKTYKRRTILDQDIHDLFVPDDAPPPPEIEL